MTSIANPPTVSTSIRGWASHTLENTLEYKGLASSTLPETMNVTDLTDTTPASYTKGGLGVSVAAFMWMYVCPVILLVGVVGNCLTIAVMRRKRLRGGTVAIYLILMAIADSCFLIVGIIPEWLEALDIVTFKKLHPATCKLEKFIGYTSGDTAIWLLVVFTFDRFVAVCFPLRKSEVCTTKRAWILGSCCLLLGIIKNLHVLWTRGAEYKMVDGQAVLQSNCGRPTPAYNHFESFVRPWIAFTFISVIPFLLICFFNVGIVKTLLCMPTAPTSPQSRSTHAERKYSQTTLMCISVSVLFLMTITPSMVIVIGRPYWDPDKRNPNFTYLTAKGINNALVFMNHSLNFFLYCLTGRRFREQLITMFRSSSCCNIDRDGFPNSAAQKASLYLKTFHKFSQEFISTSQRTEDNTVGTSISTGLTRDDTITGQSRHSYKPTMKPDKSKQSFKSLDSESSVSIPVTDNAIPEGDVTVMLAASIIQYSPTGNKSKIYKKPVKPTPEVLDSQNCSNASSSNQSGGSGGNPVDVVNAREKKPANNKTETRCSVYLDEDGKQQIWLHEQYAGNPSEAQKALRSDQKQTASNDCDSRPDIPTNQHLTVMNVLNDTVGAGGGEVEGRITPSDEIQAAGASGHPDNLFAHLPVQSRDHRPSVDNDGRGQEARNHEIIYYGGVSKGNKHCGDPV